MKIEITWEVDDGYTGMSRPQTTIMDTDDWVGDGEWETMTTSDKQPHLYDAVQEDFINKIGFSITNIEELED